MQCLMKCLVAILVSLLAGDMANAQQASQQVSFDTGTAIQLIVPSNKPDAQAVRARYYQEAITLAENYGYSSVMRLKATQRIVGKMPATLFVMAQWSDAQQWQAFKADPQWPELKALRSQGWDELALYTKTIDHPLYLEFDKDKHYTLAFAWINEDKPKDYFRYIESIDPILEEVGGRFVYKMVYPEFEAHSGQHKRPAQITLVEWDSLDGLQKLRAHPSYSQHNLLFKSGIEDFSLFRVEPLS